MTGSAGEPREQWGTRLGFVMAAVGSAVGLGNMWRFSYLAAENGGAAFVLLYACMTLLIGLPVLLAEFTVGRGARRSPVMALAHFGGNSWRPLGVLFVLSGGLIFAYYSVIAGWTVRYTLLGLMGGFAGDAAARFGEISTGRQAMAWHLSFVAVTSLLVLTGVRRGIERTSLTLMPVLFAIVVGLAIYAATLPGAGEGYAYFVTPDFGQLLDFGVLGAAASQAFFSLSLGMGAMLTYASYLSRDSHLPNESLVIAGADFAVAFVAGLVVFPLIFAFGLQQDVGESTVGALFITLPHAFAEMGDAGRVVGVLFFAALVVGALTSAISIFEVVVASLMDTAGWSRRRSVLLLALLIGGLGLFPANDLDILGAMDTLAGNLFLVLGGLLLSLFVGWRMEDPVGEVAVGASGVGWFFLWRTLLRWVVPAVLAVVLWSSGGAALDALRALSD
jgi:NSS family neurotransmitter:Na+ symporter